MSPRFYSVFSLLVCASAALGQTGAPVRKTAYVSATVTRQEGESIVTAAWTRQQRGGPSPDCSHLVHEVYAIAGLPYPYTDSFDLYAGTENFVRVMRPQAGDLVVWRGHVGIVISPAEHSFYSSLRSGPGTEFYDARYWQARGPARFYRYAMAPPAGVVLAQQRSAGAPTESAQVISVPAEDSRESPSTLADATATESNTPAPAGRYGSTSTSTSVAIPSSILVPAARSIPTSDDVAEAISELNNAAAGILREQDLAGFSRKVVFYDELAVQRVDAKGQRGSAKIRVDYRVELSGHRIEYNGRHEEVRWKLVRTSQGWEVLAQPDRVYVPRDVAVHQLAIRLALLTQDASVTHTNSIPPEEAQIVRVLSTLVQGM